jgi:UDP-N-acetylmuramoylalanine--D-glutamate ligase
MSRPDKSFLRALPLDFSGKKVLIVGLGLHGGGVGTVKFFARAGARVTVTDLKDGDSLSPSLKLLKNLKGVRYILGRHRMVDFLRTDIIIRGPGVPADSPFLAAAREKKIPVYNDIGIFLKFCPAPIIGVTGSKGKSTTATLIYQMLKKKYKSVFLAGNIRKSVFDILPRIKSDSLIVLELSSFQLEGLENIRLSPHVAVVTNILREHMNRYKSFASYAKAKSFIFKFQEASDFLIINRKDNFVRNLAKKARSKIIFFDKPAEVVSNPRLPGKHNFLNAAAAQKAAEIYGVPKSDCLAVLNNFGGLEGRLELVKKIRGAEYYNDTTATMPDAAIAAIKTLRPPEPRRLILIAGGSDKNLEFKKLAGVVAKNVDTVVYLPGDATEKIKRHLLKIKKRPIEKDARSMSEAVRLAAACAKPGDIVLLSPGAASFGLFTHEFDRGKKFIREVKKIK